MDVTVADNGTAAVEKLVNARASHPFDLAFFDINTPIIDGVEALRQVRATGIDMPIIALTATVDQVGRRRLNRMKSTLKAQLKLKCDAPH